MATITIPQGGIEYVHWTVTDLPANPPVGSVQVSIDDGTTWHPATVTGAEVSVLVAHPTAPNPDQTAIIALVGVGVMLVRLTDSPEIVIRSGGILTIR